MLLYSAPYSFSSPLLRSPTPFPYSCPLLLSPAPVPCSCPLLLPPSLASPLALCRCPPDLLPTFLPGTPCPSYSCILPLRLAILARRPKEGARLQLLMDHR